MRRAVLFAFCSLLVVLGLIALRQPTAGQDTGTLEARVAELEVQVDYLLTENVHVAARIADLQENQLPPPSPHFMWPGDMDMRALWQQADEEGQTFIVYCFIRGGQAEPGGETPLSQLSCVRPASTETSP